MEHEVYVPFSVDSVRAALSDQERVARCVPGLQQAASEAHGDGESGERSDRARITGRLRLRLAGSTITYRGWLSVLPRDEGFTAEGSGTEARGSGTVRLTLTAVPRLSDEGEGTVLACVGGVEADGRLAEFDAKAVASAGRRLLDRFATALADSLSSDPPTPGTVAPGGIGEPDDNERVIPGIPSPEVEEPPASALGEPEAPLGALADGASDGDEPRGRTAEPGASETSEGPGPGRAGAGRETGQGAGRVPGAEAAADSASPAPADAADGTGGGGRTGPSGAADGPEAGTGEGAARDAEGSGELGGAGTPGAGGAETDGGAGSEHRPAGEPDAEQAPGDVPPGEETPGGPELEQEPTGIFDTEIPPPSLDPLEERRGEAEGDGPATAEAAHARRTMIGRSAEEVDHAPPRGRYAPIPVPEPPTATATLRWAAPAAAVVVAGAIVLGRVLRRRR